MPQNCFTIPGFGYYCINLPPGYVPPGQQPGQQQGSFVPQSTILPSSLGGVFGISQVCLYPCLNLVTGLSEYRTFDTTQPQNDPMNPSSYSFKVEQFKVYRNPTIRKILWTFKDLGQVAVTWTITGTNENQQVVSQSTSVGVGNAVPTKAIMTVEVDLNITAMNMQLSVAKAAGAGPMSILKVVLIGEIEENIL
jgi:hypothetical protein